MLGVATDIALRWEGEDVERVVAQLEDKVRPEGWPHGTPNGFLERGRFWALSCLAVLRRQHPRIVDAALGRLLETYRCDDWQWEASLERALGVYDPYEWIRGGTKHPDNMAARCPSHGVVPSQAAGCSDHGVVPNKPTN